MSSPFAMQDEVDHIMEVMEAAFDPVFGEAWNRRQVLDALAMGNCHFGVLNFSGNPMQIGDRAAGFFMSRNAFDEEELLLIAVSPEARGQGVGKKLLKLFEQSACSRGVKRLILEMRDGNPAESLYVASGFSPVGRRTKYYKGPGGTRIDAITFARNIPKDSD